MKTVDILDTELKNHIESLTEDGMETFLLFRNDTGGPQTGEHGDALRGAVLHATRLVNEMRSAHELGILESLLLGQSYIGALLMTRSLKGRGRLTLDIGCAGPVRGISVEADASGDVRGYLKETPIPLEGPLESFDTAPFFGPGILTVSRFPDGSTKGFSGNVDLRYGNIGQDIANYYLVSEQTRTSVSVSVKFDRQGRITGAGGLFIEALPGASAGFLEDVQERITSMGSLGESFASAAGGSRLIEETFGLYSPVFLEKRPVRFSCGCSRERFRSFLASMQYEELADMTRNGPFPVVTVCHNCNSSYEFSRQDMQELLDRRGESDYST
jgi:molecular chaperone Hsp33